LIQGILPFGEGTERLPVLTAERRSLQSLASEAYSASANTHLTDFVHLYHTDTSDYVVNCFTNGENLVAGKNTYVYDAHTYHTKVPPQAIARLIEHFTAPGDLILDPFCGSGMTGVAAISVGRKPILIDISPAATFIALNFVTPIRGSVYYRAVEDILSYTKEQELLLYGTHCRTCGKLVPMEYMVWSYGLICSVCNREFVLWDVARDEHDSVRESKILSEFDCPFCGMPLQKRKLRRTKPYPVQVGYRCCNSGLQESKALPDEYDLKIIQGIEAPGDVWYPTNRLPDGMNTRQAIAHGFSTIDSLYTPRSLNVMSRLWDYACRWPDEHVGLKLMFTVTSLYQRVTRLSEFRFWGGSGNIANYNVPMIFNEQNVFKTFHRKAKTIRLYLDTWRELPQIPFCISTQSSTDLSQIPDSSIDYVFTDPPFGGNINYSEMNFLWESWLGVFTDTHEEAIVNRVQGKDISSYEQLMAKAFREIYRVLKPSRWLTVVFHNSSANIWSAIQTALLESGFEVEGTQTLDKKHGTFKQFVSDNAVGYDLVIHCRKKRIQPSDKLLNDRRSTSRASIGAFLSRTLEKAPDSFVVHYLHVHRENELDTRKLFSLWLQEHLEAGEAVDLDYEQFRRIVNDIIASNHQR